MSNKARANLTVMCGFRNSGKSEYIKLLRNRNIKFSVVAFDEIAMDMFSTIFLNDSQKRLVSQKCIGMIYELLLDGCNIFFDSSNCNREEREKLMQDLRKFCRKRAIRCWMSIMVFSSPCNYSNHKSNMEEGISEGNKDRILEMPEVKEGWNDILLYDDKIKSFKQIKCHNKMIV